MSDPVTNLEIEDVLSSIRRLVEDGDWQRQEAERLKAEAAAANPDPDAQETAAERFVLTPSLRVSTRGADEPESDEQDQGGDADSVEEPEEATYQPEAEISEAVDDRTEGYEAVEDAGDTSAETNHRDIDFAEINWDADPEPEDVDQMDAEQEQDDDSALLTEAEPDPAEDGLSARHRLMATVVELEAAVSGQVDEWEPDGSEEDRPVWTTAPQETRFRTVEETEAPVLSQEPEVMFHHVGPDHVTEEQLSDLAEDLGGDMNPDRSPGGGHAFAGEMDEDLDAYVADSNVIDEDTLRRIVAEIVREELQGTLGERITRNVRKLVRREIYRALASQEFE
ncbi:hypothetical protein EU803_13165 [Loktanella sp. IMCC34160]|uniref:hypothetical protein n=1 Tax=Loktanella sp. IMCC34160 TaxID=2510646 RepID=UPI00101D114B|nr:hypothetical protein [Loktanella sp. IMCC34160]RYG90932.1 hypothetical protein EU803_13165 [Loktanella sp. IMCC34160]